MTTKNVNRAMFGLYIVAETGEQGRIDSNYLILPKLFR